MKFIKSTTNRGFTKLVATDDYNVEFDIQESSSVDPHIWLGINHPRVSILTEERGWIEFVMPNDTLIESRMHLNRKQCFCVAIKLIKFWILGRL